ncbi:protein-L-isoaspartate(D-aspartate) O-methyltransferase [Pelagibacterium sp. 26DY04]|uniref:protein-L-isoaspartate(D-aspartate) O-methyltransferase n=1 Tax=Pelagibacterium sp. 26DY04 TaxID=2967130 RepID=UPI0028153EBA|nr:protein-L-isoaspartate(D-aspartate) O-methyltransferase [Pelagibacterium sp. 26DY04]WMT86147.1 protein-L-isoaspartate(D-aspartate) O-methyltransferase [Pelagibacterium sp. 26DY04]
MADFHAARKRMVEAHLAGRGIEDRRVLAAMGKVPRERFVEPGMEEFAYSDAALSIGEGQTISQPYIVAHMVEAARIGAGDKILEVGTGSGYAAAVMAELAETVFTIERHDALAQNASQRLTSLGYINVHVRIGDGSLGWPDNAPFDAIIVAAGGPVVPEALKEQLAIGGRLVIPVESAFGHQRLVRLTRVADGRFEEEDLGGVLFVPLVGEQGWKDDAWAPAIRTSLADRIAIIAEDLPDPGDPAFGTAFDRFADRRVVLLGEATHGTSEFYRARAAITRRLVERHGFTIIAVEADWPDAAAVNRYVRHRHAREDAPPPFQRFPVWMWRNREVDGLLRWLRAYNEGVESGRQAGFYGLDLYNLSASIAAVLAYLDSVDLDAAAVARERYGCLTPWQNEPSAYGRMALSEGYRGCEEAVVRQLRDMLDSELRYAPEDGEDYLDAAQSARLVASSEKYYRAMYYGGSASWNLRDRHMFETLEHLLEAKGPAAKAVVWAHNSHIGDARETEMGKARGELNIGQLCRERFGAEAVLIGFSTHAGTVAAASEWDGEMDIKTVRPSLDESVERCFHLSGKRRSLFDFGQHENVARVLEEPRLERFIGVIYRPETERYSHYAEASVSKQFDALVWFDQTHAIAPLATATRPGHVPDTFPFGL